MFSFLYCDESGGKGGLVQHEGHVLALDTLPGATLNAVAWKPEETVIGFVSFHLAFHGQVGGQLRVVGQPHYKRMVVLEPTCRWSCRSQCLEST